MRYKPLVEFIKDYSYKVGVKDGNNYRKALANIYAILNCYSGDINQQKWANNKMKELGENEQ